MFMDICNPSENSCFSKIFPLWCIENVISLDFNLLQGRFYKMRVSWEFNIYNLFKSFINGKRSSFLTRCEYYLWLDSKYNVRRCDVLVQNKNNSQSKSFRTWSNISLKMATLSHW